MEEKAMVSETEPSTWYHPADNHASRKVMTLLPKSQRGPRGLSHPAHQQHRRTKEKTMAADSLVCSARREA
jgi:hypothetical protein